MNRADDPLRTPRDRATGDERLAALLQLAKTRPMPPRGATERVLSSVYREWQRHLRSRSRRRWGLGGLAAAAAALLLIVGLADRVPKEAEVLAPLGPIAATLELVTGELWRVSGPGLGSEPLVRGDTIPVGMSLESGANSRVALRLANGSSMRLAGETSAHFASTDLLVLTRGRIYIDSGDSGNNSGASSNAGVEPGAMIVRTGLGLVREIGTQFEVQSIEEAVRIRVREGSVLLDKDGASYEAGGGSQLTITADGRVARGSVPSFGEDWQWVMEAAPSFEVEGATLESFLDWAARETGWTFRFEPQRLERQAFEVILHGSVAGLLPSEALEAVLPTCGLSFRHLEGRVEIRSAKTSP